MDIGTLLPFLESITVDSNLANFNGLVAAVDASCWIHKAIPLSYSRFEDNPRREFFYVYLCTSIMCRHVCLVAFLFRPRAVFFLLQSSESGRWI